MKKLFESLAGGILIMIGIGCSFILLSALYNPMTNEVWLHGALIWALAWPLKFFQAIFPVTRNLFRQIRLHHWQYLRLCSLTY